MHQSWPEFGWPLLGGHPGSPRRPTMARPLPAEAILAELWVTERARGACPTLEEARKPRASHRASRSGSAGAPGRFSVLALAGWAIQPDRSRQSLRGCELDVDNNVLRPQVL